MAEAKRPITISIDGRATTVEPGTTVLEAAQGLGIGIPTLCHHRALTPYASCRVCIVEMSIEKRDRTHTWIDASCAYPAEEGLVVATDSPKVRRERKVILEFLLARAPNAPLLREMAQRYGAVPGRFDSADKGESNCILCGLCVRACDERVGARTIGTTGRGVRKKVVSPLGLGQASCVGCTACAFVCPTGVITVQNTATASRVENWNADLAMSTCSDCGEPFAPQVYWKALHAKVAVSQQVMDKCPKCRRKVFQPLF